MLHAISSRVLSMMLTAVLLVTALYCGSLTLLTGTFVLPFAGTVTLFLMRAKPLRKWQRWVQESIGPVLRAAEEYCLLLSSTRTDVDTLSGARTTFTTELSQRAGHLSKLERANSWHAATRTGLFCGSLVASAAGIAALLVLILAVTNGSFFTDPDYASRADQIGIGLLMIAVVLCSFATARWLNEHAYANFAADQERRRLLRAAKLFDRLLRLNPQPDVRFSAYDTIRMLFQILPCRYLKR